MPIIDKVSRGTNFYTMELVNSTGEDLVPQTPMHSVYKMISTVMLQNGCEPGFGSGRNSQGIIEPIPVPIKRPKYGLGYVPTDDEVKMKKSGDQELARPIPHM